MANTKTLSIIEKLTQAKGWSVSTRFPYELKDSDGNLIETVWIKPLSRAESNQLRGNAVNGIDDDFSLKMLIKSLYKDKSGNEKVFDNADLAIIKRELSTTFLNDLEMAVINAGKPPDTAKFIEDEKKD